MTEYVLNFSDSERFPYGIRRSDRASRMTIRILPGPRIEVVLPRFVAEEEAHRFIRKESAWVRTTFRKMEKKEESPPRRKQQPGHPDELHFLLTGKRYRIHYLWRDVPWTGARIRDPENIDVTGNILPPENCRAALTDLIRRTAETLLPPMLSELAAQHGFTYSSATVRLQKRRWGSCSSRGAISLNAFLIFFPPELVEYVLLHELCHLRKMNHSPEFWQELERICPDALKRRKSLNFHSRLLPWDPR